MYGKLFSQMFDGTLATKGPWEALVTFQQLIILADKNGTVDMTAEAIARRTTIPHEIISTGIERLMEPDPESRSPDEEGRRIVPVSESRSWGWRIVNYDHYRKIRSEEERREYHRQYMRKRRDVKQNVKVSTASDQCQPIAVSSKQEEVKPLQPSAAFVRFWEAWPKSPRKESKGKCFALWKREGLERKADEIISHVEAMKESKGWRTGYDPAPFVYLKEERWDGADDNAPGELRVSL